ncbi:MAG: transposase [Candidatus Competibacteraceae bacterium]|nr:transposase [Candidatus Competibacteraceae bacterium]
MMDNARFHKSEETREIIEDHGHQLLFLLPYSPDLNPIENY